MFRWNTAPLSFPQVYLEHQPMESWALTAPKGSKYYPTRQDKKLKVEICLYLAHAPKRELLPLLILIGGHLGNSTQLAVASSTVSGADQGFDWSKKQVKKGKKKLGTPAHYQEQPFPNVFEDR